MGIAQSATYEMKMKSYVEYWEDILLHLLKPFPIQSATLLEGFLALGNWRSKYSKVLLSTNVVGVNLKDPIQRLYGGLKNMRPSITYTLFKDLHDGHFVLVRPHEPSLVLVWMGRAQGDVVKNEESAFFKMVNVQWCIPMKKGANLDE